MAKLLTEEKIRLRNNKTKISKKEFNKVLKHAYDDMDEIYNQLGISLDDDNKDDLDSINIYEMEGNDIEDEFGEFYQEDEDQSDAPYYEDGRKFFQENKENLRYYTFFRGYKDWPDQLDAYARFFKDKFGVYPNLVIANRITFCRMEDAFNFYFAKGLNNKDKYELGVKLGIRRGIVCNEDGTFDYDTEAYFSKKDYRLLNMEASDFGSGVIELMRVSGELAEDPDFSDDCKVSVRNKTAIPFPIIDVKATSNNLRRIMDEENVSQVLLTRIFNVSKQAVSSWVTGKALPNIDNLTVLARILNRPLEAIIVTRDR